MKKFANILCALFVIVMIASCAIVGAGASSAYQTYTYAIGGYALHSPDAYTADATIIDSEYMGLDTPLSKPGDLITDDEGNVYIADAGNNRIVCLNRYYKVEFTIKNFINEQGVDDGLTGPEGLFVTEDRIWVCDSGASRIVVFDRQGNFLKIIEAPTSNLFGDNSLYKPVAIAVDQYNRLFIVSSTTYQGMPLCSTGSKKVVSASSKVRIAPGISRFPHFSRIRDCKFLSVTAPRVIAVKMLHRK